jgi:hypothetical protein
MTEAVQDDLKLVDENDLAAFLTVIAATVHEAIRALQLGMNEPEVSPAWENLSNDQRVAVAKDVLYVLETPNVSAEMIHKNWMKQKIKDGWSYGKLKNTELKFHPSIVAFNALSDFEKTKDYLVLSIATSMRKALGF